MSYKIPNFVDALEEVLLQESKDRKEKFKDYKYNHNPSSASLKRPDGTVVGACLRQLWYRATKAEESSTPDPKNMIQAGFGDAIHYWLQNKYAKSKTFSIMSESKGRMVLDTLTQEMSYRLDGLIAGEGHFGGLEIKTTQGRALAGGTKKDGSKWGIRHEGPKDSHILQVICYMKAQPQLEWFALVYFGRDNAYRMQFNITRVGDEFYLDGVKIKDLTFDGIQARWKELEGYVERKELPPRDFKVHLKSDGTIQEVKYIAGDPHKSDFQCLYCPYATKCWSEPDAKKDAY
jgi:hypothetical protein